MRAATQASEISPRPLRGAESNDPEAGPDLEVGPGFRHPSSPQATTPRAAHAQPPRQPWTYPQRAHSPAPTTGHVPRRPARNHAQRSTCPAPAAAHGHTPTAHSPARPLDMSPGTCPAATPASTCPAPAAAHGHNAHSRSDLDMSPGPDHWTCPAAQAHPSAFMWFFIDKPTRTKIKSNNSTSCDGSHRSGQEREFQLNARQEQKPSQTQYAMEGKCSPKNASS